MRLPEQHGGARASTQRLFGGPQRVGRARCRQHHEAGRIDTPIRERQRLQRMRRLDQHDRLAGRAREHRRQQPEFADSRLRREQFDQRAGRPSAAGQFGRQLRMARVDAAHARARQLAGSP
ncbi:UNVERIFIED_ORG: hypothetical protein J2734_007525 [Burkholderia cepacia]|nr:hypothetical protein [Burkholderia cepacia]MDP9599940.1 hypothetical protein [Burkholderia cepacia]